MQSIALTPLRERITKTIIVFFALLLFIVSVSLLELDIPRFMSRLSNFPNIARLFLSINTGIISEGVAQLFVSLALAICGLIIGGLISIVLAFLASDNTCFFKPLAVVIKAFVSIIRAVPSLVLILMIVASIGIGYTSGVVGLTLSSIGYLTKAFISTIEEQDKEIAEALRSSGANWLQIVVHGYLPAVITGFLAWISIRLESSVSESISLGVVGAGGIGMLVGRAIRQHNHANITTLVLIIFLTMFIMEILITRFRRRIK